MKKVSIKELLSDYGPGTRFIEDDGFSPPSGIRIITGSKPDPDTDVAEHEPPAVVLTYTELCLGAQVSVEQGEMSQFDSTPCYVMEPEDIVKLGPYMSSLSFRYSDKITDGVVTVQLDLPKFDFAPMFRYLAQQLEGPDTHDQNP